MGNGNEFQTFLKKHPIKPGQSTKALKVLRSFCEAIESHTANKVQCKLERGYVSNLGQEWRVIIAPVLAAPTILLRAHVSAGGFPVFLDLFEEEPVRCDTEKNLRENLLRFLSQGTTRETIAVLGDQ